MRYRRCVKSFTLVELLATAGVLVIGLAILLVSLIQCSILNRIVSDRTLAVIHAQYVMEAIRNAATSESFAAAETGIDNGRWDLDSGELTGENITPLSAEVIDTSYNHLVNGTTNTNILNVTVTVSWDQRRVGAGKDTSNATLATLIGNPSP